MTEAAKASILVVDDTPANIDVLTGILKGDYRIRAATSGKAALALVAKSRPDLILLDVMMPELDGYEVCRLLKEDVNTRRIPVIFVTAMNETEDEARGFEVGCIDYITKPVNPAIVRQRVKTHLALYDQSRGLEALVRDRTAELDHTRLQVIHRLGRAAEYRDNETGMHVIRMSRYAEAIGSAAGLNAEETELLLNASPMHDVGKIGIPDNILLKPGKLDAAEWIIMKKHAEYGYEIIGENPHPLFVTSRDIALTHHEKFDGSGYPRGLKGEAIPLFGRIVAIADVFDALTTERPYKKAWPVEQAFELLRNERGKHFDSELVDTFFSIESKILDIKQRYGEDKKADFAIA